MHFKFLSKLTCDIGPKCASIARRINNFTSATGNITIPMLRKSLSHQDA